MRDVTLIVGARKTVSDAHQIVDVGENVLMLWFSLQKELKEVIHANVEQMEAVESDVDVVRRH